MSQVSKIVFVIVKNVKKIVKAVTFPVRYILESKGSIIATSFEKWKCAVNKIVAFSLLRSLLDDKKRKKENSHNI